MESLAWAAVILMTVKLRLVSLSFTDYVCRQPASRHPTSSDGLTQARATQLELLCVDASQALESPPGAPATPGREPPPSVCVRSTRSVPCGARGDATNAQANAAARKFGYGHAPRGERKGSDRHALRSTSSARGSSSSTYSATVPPESTESGISSKY